MFIFENNIDTDTDIETTLAVILWAQKTLSLKIINVNNKS